MHKLIAFVFLMICSAIAASGVLHFTVLPGKLHQGGKAAAQLISINKTNQTMTVNLAYEIYKKVLVPVPDEYLKGSDKQELPLEFIDERGYLNLEINKTMDLPEATLVHLGRVTVGQHKNGHHVRIVAKNGKSETEVFFHPHLPELGWGKVRITLHTPIPLLKNYSMEAVLKE